MILSVLLLILSGVPKGTRNPDVTQGNIQQTICRKGWTRTVRPPVSYTRSLKRKQMARLGLRGKPSEYEEDHFIPLEIGGDPTDPDNLWPQPLAAAREKDRVENWLRERVCSEEITLIEAERQIRIWPEVYRKISSRKLPK